MSRTITISTDVFAAIWAQRQDGEESEDTILRRLLSCNSGTEATKPEPSTSGPGGVYDSRNQVQFPQGFKIFRTYKHKEYQAVAMDGQWVREDDGSSYPTLNQLNASIAAGAENVWGGTWKYREENGTFHSIDKLRR